MMRKLFATLTLATAAAFTMTGAAHADTTGHHPKPAGVYQCADGYDSWGGVDTDGSVFGDQNGDGVVAGDECEWS